MGESTRGIRDCKTCIDVGCQDRWVRRINRYDNLRANTLDDARVNLPVESLRAAAVIGVGVNDRGAGARAGDAFRDDRLDGVGNARLQRAAPGTVQCRFNPDPVHRRASFSFSLTCLSRLDRLLGSSYPLGIIGPIAPAFKQFV